MIEIIRVAINLYVYIFILYYLLRRIHSEIQTFEAETQPDLFKNIYWKMRFDNYRSFVRSFFHY
jgi:hypothetical protein